MPSEQLNQSTYRRLQEKAKVSKLQGRKMLEEMINAKYEELVAAKKIKG